MAVGVVLGVSTKAFAEPSLNDQLNASQSQYQQSEASLNASQAKYAQLEDKIEALDNKIQKSMAEADQIKGKIDKTQGDIAEQKKNLEKAQQRVKAEQDLYKNRLRAMYIMGNDGYLSALLDSKGFSDFITKIDNISKIAEFDNKAIASLNERQQEVQQKKDSLEDNKKKLVSLQAESNKNIADLGKQRTAQDPLIAQYKADIAAATTASTNAKAQVDVVNGKITAQKNAEAAAQAAAAAQEAQVAAAAQAAATAAVKPVASAPAPATTTTASANTAPVSVNRGQVKVSIPSTSATPATKNTTKNTNSSANQSAPAPTHSSAASGSVISYAEQFIGVPYVWGGTSPSGFDCSGFVQYVYAHFGVSIDRTSQAQFGDGVAVSQSDLQPGDLVFFHDDGSGPGHVGMYIGGGNIIHAPHTGATVTIVPLSYMNGYCGARRVR